MWKNKVQAITKSKQQNCVKLFPYLSPQFMWLRMMPQRSQHKSSGIIWWAVIFHLKLGCHYPKSYTKEEINKYSLYDIKLAVTSTRILLDALSKQVYQNGCINLISQSVCPRTQKKCTNTRAANISILQSGRFSSPIKKIFYITYSLMDKKFPESGRL